MTVPVCVSERDLRALMEMFREDRGAPPSRGLPLSLLSELMGQIRCDAMSVFGLDSGRRESHFLQGLAADGRTGDEVEDDPGEPAFWENFWNCTHCSYPDSTGDLRSVTKVSDFYSARQWHSTGMYSEYIRPDGGEHELLACLAGDEHATGPRRTVRLMLTRGAGPDFSERDRAFLGLVRPHLREAYADAERRRSGTVRLTPRQRELLLLVAAGHTNAQIARRLGLAEGTVRKHLENAYARLQVTNRTAAVTRAFPDG
jgi:DNA-binding CsgD family transcriptional regulator